MTDNFDRAAFAKTLLAQEKRSPESLEKYRKEVAETLDKETRNLRREKLVTGPMWIYLVLLCSAFLVIGGISPDPTLKLWFSVLACFWFVFGAVFLLKYFINRNRVEMLREMKEIQLQLHELQSRMKNGN